MSPAWRICREQAAGADGAFAMTDTRRTGAFALGKRPTARRYSPCIGNRTDTIRREWYCWRVHTITMCPPSAGLFHAGRSKWHDSRPVP